MPKIQKTNSFKAALDDDDDDFFAGAAKPAEKNVTPVTKAMQRELEPASAPVSYRLLPECPCPDGHFAISTSHGGSRVLILDKMGSDWDDLLCYNYAMHLTQQVARRDLIPKERVDAAIHFISKLK